MNYLKIIRKKRKPFKHLHSNNQGKWYTQPIIDNSFYFIKSYSKLKIISIKANLFIFIILFIIAKDSKESALKYIFEMFSYNDK